MTRTFEEKPAVREKTPLLIGIVSPSGAGKTYSALRLATGIQRVFGGDIGVIDTEARRSLHYAHKFKFRHMPFGAPFSPLDYLAAIRQFVAKGVTNIVVDSASLEHEGPGGVLEMHEAALDKMAGNDYAKRDRMNMIAWAKPKQQRRQLINAILQMEANFIFCFRAKQKIQMRKGQEPLALGFQAISGEEWIYEMQLKCLLLPGSDGVPTWKSEMPGEQLMIKLPEQFRTTFAASPQLTEDIGQELATWAAGAPAPEIVTADVMIVRYLACSDAATLRALEAVHRASWEKFPKPARTGVKQAHDEAVARIAKSTEQPDVTIQADVTTESSEAAA